MQSLRSAKWQYNGREISIPWVASAQLFKRIERTNILDPVRSGLVRASICFRFEFVFSQGIALTQSLSVVLGYIHRVRR